MNLEQLPDKIENCPIREAIFELRFNPKVPGAAVFGVLYDRLKSSYPSFEQLPILQLPEAVRDMDPNLMFQPHYRLRGENVLVQIGPRLVSVNVLEPYIGWSDFKSKILDVLNSVSGLDLVDTISRFGLRYTNVFSEPILEKIKIEIVINDERIVNRETSMRTVFDEGEGFKTILQIAGEVNVTPTDKAQFTGSLVDVDVSMSDENIEVFQNMDTLLEKAHKIEKSRFFGLLKKEFLETLEPSYAESNG